MVGQWVEKGGGSVGAITRKQPKRGGWVGGCYNKEAAQRGGGVAPDTEAWIIMVQL